MALNQWSLDRLVTRFGASALIVLFVPVSFYFMHLVSSRSLRWHAAHGQDLAKSFGSQILDPLLLQDDLALHSLLHKVVSVSEGVRYACVERPDGSVLAHTFQNGHPSSLVKLWREGGGESVRFRTREGPILDVRAPIMGGQLGNLHIGMSLSQVADTTRRMIWALGLSLMGAIFLVLVGAHIVAARVSRPLHQLERAVARLPHRSGSDFPEISGTREVRALSMGVADMVDRLDALAHERATTQEGMVHAERLAVLGELAAGLAHEIYNPLDGMQEAVRYLETDPGKTARAAKFYPMLKEGLERIATVMREMLTLARTGQKVTPKPHRVADVIESLMLLVQTHLQGRNVRLTCSGSGECNCLCDRHGLSQAVLNLVLNAAAAVEGSEDPEVRIEARYDDSWVYLSIEDSGPGVPESLRGRVFDPFVTTKPVGKGTGLGLSVSRQLIRAVGGDIDLCTQPGLLGGARFVIRLLKTSEQCDA